ncbi:unnamed protein product [Penicillium salamii]|nr:unnamed protein product [Penicillium salamii]CAG8298814.1 unnamed protein product [Penicillium salamii]
MASRMAACEGCRKSKLACDHKQPICTRCEARAGLCIYRSSPFKRKAGSSPSGNQHTSSRGHYSVSSSIQATAHSAAYPNPGYLGSSSHVAIFNQISPDEYHRGEASITNYMPEATRSDITDLSDSPTEDNILLRQTAETLKLILNTFNMAVMKEFVRFWLSTGANLALAEPFTKQCATEIDLLLSSLCQEENGYMLYTQHLLKNSRLPLNFDEDFDISRFSAQFLGPNIRMETLGLFFCAVCRATIDLQYFPSLYAKECDRMSLRRLSTKIIDFALGSVLSLDTLNDLQLILQYESFIVHTHVDGDHSHHSWSRLGDVISSMFALGYHDNIEKTQPRIPPFLADLRKTAYATIYSADKNVAVYLGRPPRMSKRFSYFQLPLNATNSESSAIPDQTGVCSQWDQHTKCSYRAEICWSALCASLKEDILELLWSKEVAAYRERASDIQESAEAQWSALPSHFRLQGDLKECTRDPFERDFLAGIRLNHLHVLFLLRLLFIDVVAEPDAAILHISKQMLSLVVEVMLLRDQLINSGTGLVSKVAHYGLPAAGIILLSMLKQQYGPGTGKFYMSKALLDLGIFVAQIRVGSIVRSGDPNYALIHKAAQTVERFLQSMNREPVQTQTENLCDLEGDGEWAALFDQGVFDFEDAFWKNLADQPLLILPDSP